MSLGGVAVSVLVRLRRTSLVTAAAILSLAVVSAVAATVSVSTARRTKPPSDAATTSGRRVSEYRVSWARARATPKRREIRVAYTTSPHQFFSRAVIVERPRRVVVSLYVRSGKVISHAARLRCVELPLRAFLGSRPVIDGSDGSRPTGKNHPPAQQFRFRRRDCPQPERLQRR